MEGWNPYILEVLRKYKSADKSNWHHRMGVKVYDPQLDFLFVHIAYNP